MSAISAQHGSSGARARARENVRRAFGQEHNPLCRPVDRSRSRLLLALAAMLLASVVLAVLIAQSVLHNEEATARTLAGHRHQVVATTVSSSAEDGIPGAGGSTVAQAVWQYPDTAKQSGAVPVPPATPSGAKVNVWVDDHGRPALAPQSMTEQVTHAAIAGLGSWAGLLLTAQVLYALRRHTLDRRAEREWEPDWELVEPIWSGRFRRRPDTGDQ